MGRLKPEVLAVKPPALADLICARARAHAVAAGVETAATGSGGVAEAAEELTQRVSSEISAERSSVVRLAMSIDAIDMEGKRSESV